VTRPGSRCGRIRRPWSSRLRVTRCLFDEAFEACDEADRFGHHLGFDPPGLGSLKSVLASLAGLDETQVADWMRQVTSVPGVGGKC